jgi:hypothetical protein
MDRPPPPKDARIATYRAITTFAYALNAFSAILLFIIVFMFLIHYRKTHTRDLVDLASAIPIIG